jgi:hypothetical protein
MRTLKIYSLGDLQIIFFVASVDPHLLTPPTLTPNPGTIIPLPTSVSSTTQINEIMNYLSHLT